jgi:hypothetical protein
VPPTLLHRNPIAITYNPAARAGLNPLDVVAKVRELLAKLAVVEGPDALSREAQRNATLLFFAHARAMLAAKRVLREHRLSAEALDYVIGEIEARFHKARARTCPPVGKRSAEAAMVFAALPHARAPAWRHAVCGVTRSSSLRRGACTLLASRQGRGAVASLVGCVFSPLLRCAAARACTSCAEARRLR